MQMFFSTHYAGLPLMLDFHEGEAWKKVFGPVFIYLNSLPAGEDPLALWTDAKQQVMQNLFFMKAWDFGMFFEFC